ncbi:MAG: FAD-dependent oxidoreductase [Thermoguttaceae bacterium]|jgi:NADPH-dependent glutamate synthase beta subunit-like oxidoreductase/dihydroorotate dehydrogenase|nr:FAD-dependent oxidoreductase [Thermoguttaceae bacterium]
MTKADDIHLPVEVCGVTFRNPFYVASGPTTMTVEQLQRIADSGWGGASLKLTVYPLPYINREPRYGYYPDRNFFAFTAEKRLLLDQLLRLIEEGRRAAPELVLFANITYSGDDGPDGWVTMARQCEAAGAHVIELNMCCPNMSFNVEVSGRDTGGPKTGASMGKNQSVATEVVACVKAAIGVPLFLKLTPEGGQIGPIARAAFDAGADAVGGTANRLGIPPINLDNPTRSMYYLQEEIGMACLSGKWLRPLALRDVYEMRKACGPDRVITGVGGVADWKDAVEHVMCGADLVGICTETLLRGFGFLPELLQGFKGYMQEKGYRTLRDMRELIVPAITAAPDLTIYSGHARLKDSRPTAPCVMACPNSVPAQGYVRRVAEGRIEEAYQLIMSRSPLQSVCGLVCDHPCENECTRGLKDQPLMIREIKRFVLETARREGWRPVQLGPAEGDSPIFADQAVCETDRSCAAKIGTVPGERPRTKEPVAVVGTGPAGIAAAYDLARVGYRVTMFEAAPKPGGMLRYGIPAFRLSGEDLDREIDVLKALGVEIRTGTVVGRDVPFDSLREDHRAVFLGVGAQQGWKLNIPGEDSAGSLNAIDFLRETRNGAARAPGRRVAVVGGGFTAVDAARAARRLGAEEVFILYRRTRDEMPATPEEVLEAEEEGVRVMYLVSPREIVAEDGAVKGIRLMHYVLETGTDPSGRRRPREVPGAEFTLAVDAVIAALGQQVDFAGLPRDGLGRLTASDGTCATPEAGVFAGGDCVLGPKNVISAIAMGKRAAVSIDQYLSGSRAVLQHVPAEEEVDRDAVLARHGQQRRRYRPELAKRPPEQRAGDFRYCAAALTKEQAVHEASRCLACGCGPGCEICLRLCKMAAYRTDPTGRLILDEDRCVACGLCLQLCPNDAVEMVRT